MYWGAGLAMTDEETLKTNGYKLVTLAEFNAATDVPDGTRERVALIVKKWGGDFVVYDPNDDCEGWLLVSKDRAALAKETVEYRCQPEEPAPKQASLF